MLDRPVTLDQLMKTLGSVRHMQARYIEIRTLAALRTPLQLQGDLRFDAPDRLEKTTDPAAGRPAERVVIVGDRLTIKRGGGAAPMVLALPEHPEIGVLVESIRATLSGDGAALRQVFAVALSGDLGQWQLALQPRDPAQRTMLRVMRIFGEGHRVREIDTEDGDGDLSALTIIAQQP